MVIVMLVAGNLILLSLHLSTTDAISSSAITSFVDKPNTAADRAVAAVNGLGHSLDLASHTVSFGARSAGLATVRATSRGFRSAGQTVLNGTAYAGQSVINSLGATARTASHIVGFVSNSASVSSLIKPVDKTPVPVIASVDAMPAAQQPAVAPALASAPAVSRIDPAPQWPIHGAITTLFGVPELPYERIHTGLDISDGRSPGITPIKPFEPGIVVQVIHSYAGLGNHIVVDHGSGVTSVYGHLSSAAVQVGQRVDENTVLGYEGATGAATGTHLHFEIRVNGQAVDPHKFINGQP